MSKKQRKEDNLLIDTDILHNIILFLHFRDKITVNLLSNYYNSFFKKYRLYKPVHLIYVIDTTASMVTYAGDFIPNFCKLNQYLSELEIKYSLIKFDDHLYPYDKLISPVTTRKNIKSYKSINYLINEIDFRDGGDVPEAIPDALREINNIKSDDDLNIVIYLSDSYPHGFNDEEDAYPNGCPCNIDYTDEIKKLRESNVKFICYNLDLIKIKKDYWYIESSIDFLNILLKKTDGVLISKYNEIKNYILTHL